MFTIICRVNVEQEVQESGDNSSFHREEIIYTYSGITLATIFLALAHSVFYFIFFMRASINMHAEVFEKVLNATMNFFNTNPTGRILNRFSKDIGIIDEYIPFVLSDVVEVRWCTNTFSKVLIVFVLIDCSFVNWRNNFNGNC